MIRWVFSPFSLLNFRRGRRGLFGFGFKLGGRSGSIVLFNWTRGFLFGACQFNLTLGFLVSYRQPTILQQPRFQLGCLSIPPILHHDSVSTNRFCTKTFAFESMLFAINSRLFLTHSFSMFNCSLVKSLFLKVHRSKVLGLKSDFSTNSLRTSIS